MAGVFALINYLFANGPLPVGAADANGDRAITVTDVFWLVNALFAGGPPPKPDLVAKAIIPDVLLGAHVAPLQFAFYTGKQFPESYRGGAFVAEHGSWNRAKRSGYQIAFVAFKNGKPSAGPVPFMTGLVPDPGKPDVYGRPVGVTMAPDGSLLVSDDGAGVVYRISVAK